MNNKSSKPANHPFPPLRYSSLVYTTDGPSLPLLSCLEVAGNQIKQHYKTHVEARTGVPLDEFWQDVREIKYQAWPDNSATMLAARICESAPSGPVAFAPLYVAGAFYWEAFLALREDQGDRSWAALLQCFRFLGVAEGQELSAEHGRKGGKAHSEAFDQFCLDLRPKLLGWLGELPESSYSSVTQVIAAVKPKAKAFTDEWSLRAPLFGRGRTNDVAQLIWGWSGTNPDKADPEVRAAMERLVNGGIRRGRRGIGNTGAAGQLRR